MNKRLKFREATSLKDARLEIKRKARIVGLFPLNRKPYCSLLSAMHTRKRELASGTVIARDRQRESRCFCITTAWKIKAAQIGTISADDSEWNVPRDLRAN